MDKITITVRNNNKVFLEIERDDTNKWIYARWMGQLTTDDVKEGAIKVLGEIRDSGYCLLLNDNKHLVGHWDEANEWIAQEWVPMAIEAGLNKFAHVVSDYSFGQASAETMKINVGESFEMHLFDNIDKASSWLTTQNC